MVVGKVHSIVMPSRGGACREEENQDIWEKDKSFSRKQEEVIHTKLMLVSESGEGHLVLRDRARRKGD